MKKKKELLKLTTPVVLWLLVMVPLMYIAPDMDVLVREHGQHDIPEGYSTQVAEEILANNEGESGEEILVLYESGENLKEFEDEILKVADAFLNDPENIKVNDVITPFDGDRERELLLSQEENHLLLIIDLDMGPAEISFIRNELADKTEIEGLTRYITGAAIIEDDVLTTTEERLGMIEYLTVGLVYGVLLIVFKSPIAPLVPLVTLGASYFTSVSIVALLIQHFGFPVSNFSQVFVLTVTFAIGTDYVIILMKRYQEEIGKDGGNGDNMKRVRRTFRFTRGAVLSSAITGFVGFVTIGLSDFNLYRSGVGVAVAVVVLVLGIWTWVPFFMGIPGKSLFWPMHKKTKTENHRLWGFIGRYSTGKPVWSLVGLILLLVPLLVLFRNERSFHSLDELESDTDSVIAFELIEEHYGKGEFFYANLIIELEDSGFDHHERISNVEMITRDLLRIEEIEEIRTLTRPEGVALEAIRMTYHADLMAQEVNDALEGMEEMDEGLTNMIKELDKALGGLEDSTGGIEELIDGTAESRRASSSLGSGARETGTGVRQMRAAVDGTRREIQKYYDCLSKIDSLFERIIGIILKDDVSVLRPVLEPMEEGLKEIRSLQRGLDEVNRGLNEIAAGANRLESGLREIEEGQREMLKAMEELINGLDELYEGLIELSEGIGELREGIDQLEGVLREVADQEENVLEGIFIPEDLYEDSFGDAWDAYGTPNRKVTVFQSVLAVNPYGESAMDLVTEMEEVAAFSLQGTEYEDATIAMDGLPARNRDLRRLSREAFFQTAIYMLIGIFVVLLILFKSIIMPLYAMLSLVITYIASQTIVEVIFINGMGYPGVMWSVPFFTFVMLMSMGVDYSIFLLTRFNEEMGKKNGRGAKDVRQGMLTAMKKVGGAVFSAATILGASFAAITFSGIQSLVQIGLWIIIGLSFYVFIILPVFIPAVATVLGESNWWPYSMLKKKRIGKRNQEQRWVRIPARHITPVKGKGKTVKTKKNTGRRKIQTGKGNSRRRE